MHVQPIASAVPRGRIVRPTLAEIAAIGIGIDGPGIPGNAAEIEDAGGGAGTPQASDYGTPIAALEADGLLTLSGANVDAWGSAHDAGSTSATSTASTEPQYEATGWAGSLPCVRLQDDDHFDLDVIGAAWSGTSAITYVATIDLVALPTGTDRVFRGYNSGGSNPFKQFRITSTPTWQTFLRDDAINTSATNGSDTPPTTGRHSLLFRDSGSEFNLYIDGTHVGNYDPGAWSTPATITLDAFEIGNSSGGLLDWRVGGLWVYGSDIGESAGLAAVAGMTSRWPIT